MFFGQFLSRLFLRTNRVRAIKAMLVKLPMQPAERELYMDSLDILDDAAFEAFYIKMVQTVQALEDKEQMKRGSKQAEEHLLIKQNVQKREVYEQEHGNTVSLEAVFENL